MGFWPILSVWAIVKPRTSTDHCRSRRNAPPVSACRGVLPFLLFFRLPRFAMLKTHCTIVRCGRGGCTAVTVAAKNMHYKFHSFPTLNFPFSRLVGLFSCYLALGVPGATFEFACRVLNIWVRQACAICAFPAIQYMNAVRLA